MLIIANVTGEGHDHVEVIGSDVEIVFRHSLFLGEGEGFDGEPLDVANLALRPRRESCIRRDTGNQVQADRLKKDRNCLSLDKMFK